MSTCLCSLYLSLLGPAYAICVMSCFQPSSHFHRFFHLFTQFWEFRLVGKITKFNKHEQGGKQYVHTLKQVTLARHATDQVRRHLQCRQVWYLPTTTELLRFSHRPVCKKLYVTLCRSMCSWRYWEPHPCLESCHARKKTMPPTWQTKRDWLRSWQELR